MFELKIASRLRPFSHQPGVEMPLPGTLFVARLFPKRVELRSLVSSESISVDLPFTGALRDFTAQLDLERGRILFWGESSEGYLRFLLGRERGEIVLRCEKGPLKGRSWQLASLPPGERTIPRARLCLGEHHLQDGQLMQRRLDPKELLPFWHRLALFSPPLAEVAMPTGGSFSLLKRCYEAIERDERDALYEALSSLLRVGFSGLFCPEPSDRLFQGILDESAADASAAPQLLAAGSHLLSKMLLDETEKGIHPLPCLPRQIPSGRARLWQLRQGHLVDFEWRQTELRRMIIHPALATTTALLGRFASCRLTRLTPTGPQEETLLPSQSFALTSGEPLYLDRFQK